MKAKQIQQHCEKQSVRRVRVALLCVAVILVVLGILNGGMHDVLVKSIQICTECIGLG